MHKKSSDYELIQRFFEFELNEKEVQDFEERMEIDRRFFQKIQAYDFVDKKIDKDFTGNTFEDKATLQQQWHTELSKQERKIATLKPSKKWWLMAASIAVIVSAALWTITLLNSKTNYQELALDKWKDAPELSTNRSFVSTDINPMLIDAIASYEAEEYEACLSGLTKIETDTAIQEQVLLLRGQTFFRLEQPTQALVAFQQVLDLEDGGKQDIAYWSQALIHIHMENIGEAKRVLQIIIDENYYPLAKDAKALLQQL